jgi:hypothetical protein
MQLIPFHKPMQLTPFHKVTVRAVPASDVLGPLDYKTAQLNPPAQGLKGSRRQRRQPQKAMRLDRPREPLKCMNSLTNDLVPIT